MYIEIRNLTFRYKNSKEYVIENFDLDINKGEIISLQGESGCGKSTILRLMAGLETPRAGSIKIDKKVMVDDSLFIMPEKRGVGMVFQDYALFPHMTVIDNVKFGLKNMGRKEKEKRAQEVLELVNLFDLKGRYPYELSGGQQQRVAIARALAPEPSVLLLDEPFSNLDADLTRKIRGELKELLKKIGITTVLVTHDREDSKAVAERVIVVSKKEEERDI